MTYSVEITTSPSRMLAVARFHIGMAELGTKDEMGKRLGAAFGTVAMHLGRLGVAPQGPAVACYRRAGDGLDAAVGFPVSELFDPGDGVEMLDMASLEVAHTTHFGPFDEVTAAYDAMRAAVQAQGRALDDNAAMWEEYWSAPGAPPDQNRTEVFWPLVKTG